MMQSTLEALLKIKSGTLNPLQQELDTQAPNTESVDTLAPNTENYDPLGTVRSKGESGIKHISGLGTPKLKNSTSPYFGVT